MLKSPILSIIAVFDRADTIESSLGALYGVRSIPFELIVVNDCASPHAHNIIESVLAHHNHDHTFYFQHEGGLTRGNSLNEAMVSINTPIIWVVDNVEVVDTKLLQQALDQLQTSEHVGAVYSPQFNPTFMEMGEDAFILSHHQQQNYLWKWEEVPASHRFFNPFLQRFHHPELWIRIHKEVSILALEAPFMQPMENVLVQAIKEEEKNELYISWDRSHRISTSVSSNRSTITTSSGKGASHLPQKSEQEWIRHIQLLKDQAEIKRALIFAQQALDLYPESNEIRAYIAGFFEQQGRYVEASEMKKTLKERLAKLKKESETSPSTDSSEEKVVVKPDDQQISDKEQIDSPRPTEEGDSSTNLVPESESLSNPDSTESEPSVELPVETPNQNDTLETDSEKTNQKDEDSIPETHESDNDTTDSETEIQPDDETKGQDPVTLIIPTTGYGQPALESLFKSLEHAFDPNLTSLIVVDNASMDDTYSYLDVLEGEGFFNLKVIRNSHNKGFGPSVNQALEEATTPFVLVTHNDVVFREPFVGVMQDLLHQDDTIGIIAPLLSASHHHEQHYEHPFDGVRDVYELDSACFLMRKDDGYRFDERFYPAYFEDTDLVHQLLEKGKRTVVCGEILVEHQMGLTTGAMGYRYQGEQYWKMESQFHKKWPNHPVLPEGLEDYPVFERLLLLSHYINPLFPQTEIMEKFVLWFDDKTKTELLAIDLDEPVLFAFIELMVRTDTRDVLRQLEDKAGRSTLPEELVLELVEFYFRRQIFSRCTFYIKEHTHPQDRSFLFDVIYLKILLSEHAYEEAYPLLNYLFRTLPNLPDLYEIIIDLSRKEGDVQNAEDFRETLDQIRPAPQRKLSAST